MGNIQSAPKKGFLKVYNLLRCIPHLDGQDAMILSAIAEQLRLGKSRLSLGWIASRAMTSKRTVRRRIRLMHSRGLLKVQHNGIPAPNDYRFAGQALALLRDAGISPPDADSVANLKEYSPDREGSGGLPSRAAGSSRDAIVSDARGLK